MKKIVLKPVYNLIILAIIFAVTIIAGCAKDEDTEKLQPEIEIISPEMCDTLYFDEAYTYKFKLTDPSGDGFGNLSMDVHHNFDHHTHGDHLPCEMDPKKQPFNPYEEAWIFDLPDDKSEYIFETEITIPSEVEDKEDAYHDYGDYHFHIYVTNNEGYQVFTTFDFKLLYKDGHPDDPWE